MANDKRNKHHEDSLPTTAEKSISDNLAHESRIGNVFSRITHVSTHSTHSRSDNSIDSRRDDQIEKPGFWHKVGRAFHKPGKNEDIDIVAPSFESINFEAHKQEAHFRRDNKREWCMIALKKTGRGLKKLGSFDWVLDRIVDGFSSVFAFLTCIAILIAWTVAGIVLNAPMNWQIIMEDGQSIITYAMDTLLMRQQQNHEKRLKFVMAELRSRNCKKKQILRDYHVSVSTEIMNDLTNKSMDDMVTRVISVDSTRFSREDLMVCVRTNPHRTWFDIICDFIAEWLGSLVSVFVYWIGIFIWVGCGAMTLNTGNDPPYTDSNPEYAPWSDNWQMYINTAVAVVLLLTSCTLQHIRAQHMAYMEQSISSSVRFEQLIDEKLSLLCPHADEYKNGTITVQLFAKRDKLERMIDYYADIIGSGAGVIISIAAFVIWFIIGTPMHWDSNWWLIIGTFTGLAGFIDGFILRNVFYRIEEDLQKHVSLLREDDAETFEAMDLDPPPEHMIRKSAHLMTRISEKMGRICSHKYVVVLAVLTVIGLICASSGMRWSVTGQLISNTPTMIIEGFFLIILIQAHTESSKERRANLDDILYRRLVLLNVIDDSLKHD